MNRVMVVFFLFLGGLAVSVTSAQALQFELADCDGTVRFVQVIEADQPHLLKIALKDDLKGQALLISETQTKKVVAKGSTLLFEDIWADQWKLCSMEGEKIGFDRAEVIKSNSKLSRNTILGVAGAGGVTLAALGISGAFSSSSSENRAGMSTAVAVEDGGAAGTSDDTGATASPSDFNPDDYPIGAPGAPLSPFR